jgi:hypothetical protein
MDSNALVDSSARHPPPKCHPGTRETIGEKLEDWLTNPAREHGFMVSPVQVNLLLPNHSQSLVQNEGVLALPFLLST